MIMDFGLLDIYVGMIILIMFSLWVVFMYINFFKVILDILIEVVKLDGVSDLKILFWVVLLMFKLIMIVIFLFFFIDRWMNLFWDMFVMKSDGMVILNVLIL